MAKSMIARNVCNMLRNNSSPCTTITNIIKMPNPVNNLNMLPCTSENNVRSSSNSVMLRNLRMAVTPSYGEGSNKYEAKKMSTCSSSLAGDPKRLRNCQNIRAEVLEKWTITPKLDTQRNWIKNRIYNTFAL